MIYRKRRIRDLYISSIFYRSTLLAGQILQPILSSEILFLSQDSEVDSTQQQLSDLLENIDMTEE